MKKKKKRSKKREITATKSWILFISSTWQNRPKTNAKRRSSSWFFIKELADKALITEIMLISIFQKRGGRPKAEKVYSVITTTSTTCLLNEGGGRVVRQNQKKLLFL